MTETTDIIKALKYWNAERFKSLQRKLTTAKNPIQNEALSAQFKPFLSDDEIKTLTEASRILGSVKNKIAHAKEIKAREEKERAFDTKYSGTVHAAGVKWWQEVTEFLEENLWHYDEAPDPDKLDTVQRQFGEVWRTEVQSNHGTRGILERFDTEASITASTDVHRLGE